MLVLSRNVGEAIWIGDNVKLIVRDCQNGRVSLAFDAPRSVPIVRSELERKNRTHNEGGNGHGDAAKE